MKNQESRGGLILTDFTTRKVNNKITQKDIVDTASEFDKLDTHFIFNALNTIKCAALSDSDKACSLINDIGVYIRYSMQNIRKSRCVAFKEEIKYVKSYINLQQSRFPGIDFTCKINDIDFSLPSMSVIFLCENAIRHGFKGTEKRGSIEINTWHTGRYHVVQICDNGIGFNTDFVDMDRRYGTLGYIKYQIENLCNGQLILDSINEQGTSVQIKIPLNYQNQGGKDLNENDNS